MKKFKKFYFKKILKESPEVFYLNNINPEEISDDMENIEISAFPSGYSQDAEDSSESEPQPLTLVGGAVAVPGLQDVASADDIQMVDADGNAVPDWISVDLETGELKVDVPADFTGGLEINMTLPGGEVFSVSVE